jgi:hypothetical protein
VVALDRLHILGLLGLTAASASVAGRRTRLFARMPFGSAGGGRDELNGCRAGLDGACRASGDSGPWSHRRDGPRPPSVVVAVRRERNCTRRNQHHTCRGSELRRNGRIGRTREQVAQTERRPEQPVRRCESAPQQETNLPSCSEEERLDRRPAHPERDRELVIGKARELAENKCLALLPRQLGNRQAQ